MLWYKSWLETRYRMLLILTLSGVGMSLQYSAVKNMSHASLMHFQPLAIVSFPALLAVSAFIILSGAGITTQTLMATKGLHGSMQYTLALPASRLRMVMVRVGIGWLEAATVIGIICGVLWMVIPWWRLLGTPLGMAEQAATLIACGSVFYSLAVLLATFLDDQMRALCSLLAMVVLWWFSVRGQLPAAIDLIAAMGKRSPLIAHTMPWTQMGFSLGLALVLLFAAVQVARRREY